MENASPITNSLRLRGGMESPARQRTFNFSASPKAPPTTHAWVSKSGAATSLFIRIVKDDDKKDAVLEAISTKSLRGKPRVSEKNTEVISVLVGSNKHIAMTMAAANAAFGSDIEIKDSSLNFFTSPPCIYWKWNEDNHVKVTGALYLLHYFLADENGFDAIPIVENTEYIIKLDDNFNGTHCSEMLKELAEEWGWAAPCPLLPPSAPSDTHAQPPPRKRTR